MKSSDHPSGGVGADCEPRGKPKNAAQALAASEVRYRRLFESAKDGILILDAETGMVEDVNPYLTNLLGFSREDFLGMRVWELGFFKHLAANADKFLELQAKEYVRYEDLPLETVDGQTCDVEVVSNVYQEGGRRVIQCNIRDITTRKEVESYRALRQRILQSLNEPGEADDILPRALALLKTKGGFDAVGIRLQDGDDFPYFSRDGFSEDILQPESALKEGGKNGGPCPDDKGKLCLDRICGLVLSGKTDPANSLFTPGGSAWTNDSTLPLDLPPGEEPRQPRMHDGFASVALVPIRKKDEIMGLLQFGDRRKSRFTLEILEILEDIGSNIGSALMRAQAEQALMMKSMLLEAQKEAAPDGILAVDNKGHVLLFNTRFAEIWQIPENVLAARNNELTVEYVSKQLKDPKEFLRTVGYLNSLNEERISDELNFLDGRCFERYTAPLTDAEGKFRGRIYYFHDITGRKRAEEDEARLSNQLRHAQKMDAPGR